MNEKTQSDYRKLAANFYKRIDGVPSPKKIQDTLKQCAEEYRPAYWRRLRNALEFDQNDKGFGKSAERIAGTKNPFTDTGDRPKAHQQNILSKLPAKQKRAKSMKEVDLAKLLEVADDEVKAALIIVHLTGCRPAEIPNIKVEGDRVFIPSAKTNEKGDRGLDRWLDVGVPKAKYIGRQVNEIKAMEGKNGPMPVIQARLQRLSAKTFPRRKSLPSLYSLRHQMGSNLKASGMDRSAIAYVMGHQSTGSVDVYGDRRIGDGNQTVSPGVDEKEINNSVRVTHSENSAPKAAEKAQASGRTRAAEMQSGFDI